MIVTAFTVGMILVMLAFFVFLFGEVTLAGWMFGVGTSLIGLDWLYRLVRSNMRR